MNGPNKTKFYVTPLARDKPSSLLGTFITNEQINFCEYDHFDQPEWVCHRKNALAYF
jgi:hypothetical protein